MALTVAPVPRRSKHLFERRVVEHPFDTPVRRVLEAFEHVI